MYQCSPNPLRPLAAILVSSLKNGGFAPKRCPQCASRQFGSLILREQTSSTSKYSSCCPLRRAAVSSVVTMAELASTQPPSGQSVATFAGGCFWGLELAYQREPGVIKTSVGFTQGQLAEPTYQKVCGGNTGHAEAVQVYYNPSDVSYDRLVQLFVEKVGPLTSGNGFSPSDSQYRSGIYYHDSSQKAALDAAIKAALEQSPGRKPAIEILPATDYWLAEDYHQQYLQKGGQNAAKRNR